MSRSIWVLIFALLAPGAASAQVSRSEKTAYLLILERYTRGDGEGAARAVLQRDAGRTRRVARAAMEGREPPAVMRRRQKLAVLVHTEASLRTAPPDSQLLIARDAVDKLWDHSEDGRDEGVRQFVRDWYLLVASQLSALGHLESLKRHVDDGLSRLGDDPELLLARGSLHELNAEASVVDRSLIRRLYTPPLIAQWRLGLYDARDDYRRAFEHAPDLLEARLRWGRIQGVLGEPDAARQALSEVATGAAHPFLRYLAHLFKAELAEQSGDVSGAQAGYELALGLWPTAHAPKMSLSRLCVAGGDTACARAWLSRSLEEAGQSRMDPWWDYFHGQSWLGDERLTSLRRRGLSP